MNNYEIKKIKNKTLNTCFGVCDEASYFLKRISLEIAKSNKCFFFF